MFETPYAIHKRVSKEFEGELERIMKIKHEDDNMSRTRNEIINYLEKRNKELQEQINNNKDIIQDLKEGGSIHVTGR